MDFVRVASINDVTSESPFVGMIDDEEVAVFRSEDSFFALCNVCPHREAPLNEGLVERGTLTCPYHFSKFDLKTGDVLDEPATHCVKKYEVRVVGEDILIGISGRCSKASR